jgi:hypothetical protein
MLHTFFLMNALTIQHNIGLYNSLMIYNIIFIIFYNLFSTESRYSVYHFYYIVIITRVNTYYYYLVLIIKVIVFLMLSRGGGDFRKKLRFYYNYYINV